MTKLLRLALILLLMGPLPLQAAEQPPQPGDQPIEVTAQQLEALRAQGQTIFTGGVVAKQGDITLYCDKLVVFSQEQQQQQQVDRLEASGHVRVVQLDRTGTAEKAIYQRQQGILELIGSAELHQGQNQVSGDEITLFLHENRSIVKSGDGGRVKAVLFPEPKRKQP